DTCPCDPSSLITMTAGARTEAHPASAHSTAAATTTATAAALVPATFPAAALLARRALFRNRDIRRYRRQIQRLPDEGAQRDHQLRRMDRPPRRHVTRSLSGQPHMLFRAEQDDIRQ